VCEGEGEGEVESSECVKVEAIRDSTGTLDQGTSHTSHRKQTGACEQRAPLIALSTSTSSFAGPPYETPN
jgi:hypothetical protein